MPFAEEQVGYYGERKDVLLVSWTDLLVDK